MSSFLQLLFSLGKFNRSPVFSIVPFSKAKPQKLYWSHIFSPFSWLMTMTTIKFMCLAALFQKNKPSISIVFKLDSFKAFFTRNSPEGLRLNKNVKKYDTIMRCRDFCSILARFFCWKRIIPSTTMKLSFAQQNKSILLFHEWIGKYVMYRNGKQCQND